MPTFTRETVEHLGDLAKIALTDEEATRMPGRAERHRRVHQQGPGGRVR
ncbi:aspartyl/glutamyl-tRNA(Asn/Gln) amidotransferase subunit C [Bifidobacterium bohemicum DSM 22767]|uniref:Aspartyl/glutamyl-tRNA(Asn/Gln) amidotransferase subunit C n=1 Tax=Bifidobacterium bohemicum DSM 22767 TaxID=1437606 RepID=A0A086ZHJ6_9BIFI|nr:aspartyl/glutamyl-tRNA(Asn/Gln) amidotransferase subunit C [Bifidobacterium bohemicum DSM 22767]